MKRVIKKIKEKIKEKINRLKERKKTKKRLSAHRKEQLKELRGEIKQPSFSNQQAIMLESKYYTPEFKTHYPYVEELPAGYKENRMVLLTRDPWWIHTYWELSPFFLEKIKNDLREEFFNAKRVLRVYDVTNIVFDGTNAHRYFDVEINDYANNWYIDTAGPGRSWCVDLGLKLASGKFITLLRSNVVSTPLDGSSSITDEEWMVPEEIFARLYGIGAGLGVSSPVKKGWQQEVRKKLWQPLASGALSSLASPVKKKEAVGARKFWLIVNTELIVYGATEPDATVYVQGKQIPLRPDGTFSLRFALPDGKQVIPVKGISKDRLEEQTITPVVTKETR